MQEPCKWVAFFGRDEDGIVKRFEHWAGSTVPWDELRDWAEAQNVHKNSDGDHPKDTPEAATLLGLLRYLVFARVCRFAWRLAHARKVAPSVPVGKGVCR